MGMKEAYEKKLEAQLDEWKADINALKAKIDTSDAEMQLEYYKNIEALRSQQEAAREKLAELKQAGEGAWEDLKAGIESAWDSLGKTVKSIDSRHHTALQAKTAKKKELYLKEKKAQLKELQTGVDKLKTRTSGVSADAKVKMNKHIKELEDRIEAGKSKLAELADASGGAWESLREGVDSAWDSLKSAFRDAQSRF